MVQGKLLTVYCIDSSALIDINRIYPERNSFFANIWKRMNDLTHESRLISPLEVFDEIKVHQDEIYNWCRDRKKQIFFDIDDKVEDCVREVNSKYESTHLSMMTANPGPWADPWVIALSKVHDAILVTSEKGGARRNSMPFIAKMMDVDCLNVLGFFDEIQPNNL